MDEHLHADVGFSSSRRQLRPRLLIREHVAHAAWRQAHYVAGEQALADVERSQHLLHLAHQLGRVDERLTSLGCVYGDCVQND